MVQVRCLWLLFLFSLPSTSTRCSFWSIKLSKTAFNISDSLSTLKSFIRHLKAFRGSHSEFLIRLLLRLWFNLWIKRGVNLSELFKQVIKIMKLHLNLLDVILNKVRFVCNVCEHFLRVLETVLCIIAKFINLSRILIHHCFSLCL